MVDDWEARINDLTEAGLSPTQAKVRYLIEQGLTHREIGERLDMPKGTVDTHARRLKRKYENSKQLVEVMEANDYGTVRN